jgi:hypothetical protein
LDLVRTWYSLALPKTKSEPWFLQDFQDEQEKNSANLENPVKVIQTFNKARFAKPRQQAQPTKTDSKSERLNV